MVNIIMVKDVLNENLEMNSTVTDFLDMVDELSDNEIHIDFTGVKFISCSFAQGYYTKKLKLNKKIVEVNIPSIVQPMFDIMERNFKH